MYVLGVGVAGGMVLKARPAEANAGQVAVHDALACTRRKMGYQQRRNVARTSHISLLTGRRMTRFSHLTLRNFLIAAARRAGDGGGAVRRLLSALRRRRVFYRPPAAAAAHPALFPRLQRRRLLPLQSDHHEMALHLAAGCAEHPARGDRADAGAAGAGLHLSSRRTFTARSSSARSPSSSTGFSRYSS